MLRSILLATGLVAGALSLHAQVLSYSDGHNAWNPDTLGDIRAVVYCPSGGAAAFVHIPWRRRDEHPELKRIIVEDGQTRKRVADVHVSEVTREYGDIYFRPVSGKGRYYVYYLPYKNEGRSNYPRGVYLKPDTGTWRAPEGAIKATTEGIQYINAFNSFYPMEVIATRKETEALDAKHAGEAFVVFPEDRRYPIRMKHDLPYRWIERKEPVGFDTAEKDENYAFQLGVYALKNLRNVKVTFSDWGEGFTADRFNCINTQGVSYDGKPFEPTVDVAERTVQPLWCWVTIPSDARPGTYKGSVTVKADSLPAVEVPLQITVGHRDAVAAGVNEPYKMTRLPWLNSTLAQENTVIAPYTPLQVTDTVINLLGRDISIGRDGLPAQIRTYFTPEMTSIGTEAHPLLTEPIHFHIDPAPGGAAARVALVSSGLRFIDKTDGTVTWEASSTSEALQMDVHGSLEFDGFLSYTVRLVALEDLDLRNTRWHMPLEPDAAKYLIGLNRKGGYRPDSLSWKWDVAHKNQDGAWIGNVNEGVQFSLRDQHYVRPLNTNFYLLKPLVLPDSWGNEGKGGIEIGQKGKAILVNAYTGARTMHKGDTLYYNFNLLITPFHALNTDFQWANRFYHKYNNLDTIQSLGATVVNIHHATPINPWINYPFIEWARMKGYIDTAHSKGIKVKIYNTIRELSDHAYELPVLRSLGHEVYSSGKGGGFAWLQEHVGDDYIPAWFVPEIKDAAIINSGMNRWHNYYVEGMNWLVQNVGIDGIYLDDVAFDRVTMKRIKRVLTQDGHPGIIDLHSANQYDASDGWNNSANLYMEHFPYLNRLWFGEYFDYEKNTPDFFLTEVSGIPFGLMGEMLQGGGNPWRGMIYGMTNRLGWTDVNDPRPLWALWDAFGMKGSEMLGYWSGHCPVTTDQPQVLATVYKRKGKALVALASWAPGDVQTQLTIDWKALGIDPSTAEILAPEIRGFQPGKVFPAGKPIPVAPGKGWLLIIQQASQ
ncbi:glycoside hydrolase domain-containing protein [Dinghuibacter silviterrae]|uniref:Glycoside hydrolase 123-like N-terminal domain-containing protein n=1 Tax=Dinghuibacter silviterrae TaxID=1539049 RepID=A0A4R8DPG4_9BACT|nr:glycoside hydrolase domain-containing protein [Dinghuibacter silviterrae]TDW99597.1 hypothetical protein EDB95_0607 [Dinghuibacter silviterrae]